MTDKDERISLSENYNRAHAARLQSPTSERLYQAAYGDEYPAEIIPSGFYTRTILRRLVDALDVGPGNTLADLGCGHGRTGLWVAQQLGADLVGIDLSAGGVALAQKHATEFGLADRSRFLEGDLTATGLSDASCDAVMSLDVLVLVPDKPAAANEVARILRPGGRFCFTTWDQEGYSERLNAPQLTDHRPLLTEAGFTIETYEEPQDWRDQQRALLEGIVNSETELVAERGPEAGARYVARMRGSLVELPDRRYVFVVARR